MEAKGRKSYPSEARMVTDLYAHADTEDRRLLAQKVEQRAVFRCPCRFCVGFCMEPHRL